MSKRTAAGAKAAAASSGDEGRTGEADAHPLLAATDFDAGRFSLIRDMHLADLITELNGFCGVLSVFSSMRHMQQQQTPGAGNSAIWAALALMPLGLFFDFMDGKVARWRKKSSLMGQELDSLADLISFGMAPAAAAFAIGLRTPLDQVILAFFVLCGLTRLARFNVTAALLPKDASGKAAYFEGTPIPTTLALAALMAEWVRRGWVGGELPGGVWGVGGLGEVHPVLGLWVLSGVLMTSRTIHIPKP